MPQELSASFQRKSPNRVENASSIRSPTFAYVSFFVLV